jgi:hypothetical protein
VGTTRSEAGSSSLERVAYTIPEFCFRNNISRPTYHRLRSEGRGPVEMRAERNPHHRRGRARLAASHAGAEGGLQDQGRRAFREGRQRRGQEQRARQQEAASAPRAIMPGTVVFACGCGTRHDAVMNGSRRGSRRTDAVRVVQPHVWLSGACRGRVAGILSHHRGKFGGTVAGGLHCSLNACDTLAGALTTRRGEG